jgi:uncharacterized protein
LAYTLFVIGDANSLTECAGFDWDEGNLGKNWASHKVTDAECEQGFFNLPLVVADDVKHSQVERRFYALGQTDAGRLLFLVFTVRRKLIRVRLGARHES